MPTTGAVGDEKKAMEMERSLVIFQGQLLQEMITKLEEKKSELFNDIKCN